MTKIVKNILITLFLISATTTAFANEWYQSSGLDGFYAGLQLGANNLNVDKNVKVLYSDRTAEGTPSGSDVNVLTGIYIGYGAKIENLYLGLEADWKYQFNKVTSSEVNRLAVGQSYSVDEKLDNSFGIAVVPGYYFTNSSKLYFKAGMRYGMFKSTSSDAGDLGVSGGYAPSLFGYQFGIGFQQQIASAWSMRLEYDYIRYNNTTKTSSSSGLGVNTRTSFKISSNQVLLGLTYHFDTTSSYDSSDTGAYNTGLFNNG